MIIQLYNYTIRDTSSCSDMALSHVIVHDKCTIMCVQNTQIALETRMNAVMSLCLLSLTIPIPELHSCSALHHCTAHALHSVHCFSAIMPL